MAGEMIPGVGNRNFVGRHASDAAALTYIQLQKWDSSQDGTGDPLQGMWYYDTATELTRIYNGTAWISIAKGADHDILSGRTTANSHPATAISTIAKANLGGTTDVESGLSAIGTVAVKTLGAASGNVQETGGALIVSKLLATDGSSKIVTTGISATHQTTITDSDSYAPTSGSVVDFSQPRGSTSGETISAAGAITLDKTHQTFRVDGDGSPVTNVTFGGVIPGDSSYFFVQGTSNSNTVTIVDNGTTILTLRGTDSFHALGDLSLWTYYGSAYRELARIPATENAHRTQEIDQNADTVYIFGTTETIELSTDGSDYTGLILDGTYANKYQKIKLTFTGANSVDIPASATTLNKRKVTMRIMDGQSIDYEFNGTEWVEQNRIYNQVSVRSRLSFNYVMQRTRASPPNFFQFDDADSANSDHFTPPVQYYLDCTTASSGFLDTVISTPNKTMTLSLVNGGSGYGVAGVPTMAITDDNVAITYDPDLVTGTTVAKLEAAIGTGDQAIFVKTPGTPGTFLTAAAAFGATAFAGGVDMVVTCDNYDIINVSATASMTTTGGTNGIKVVHMPLAGGRYLYGDYLYTTTWSSNTATCNLRVAPGDTITFENYYSNVVHRKALTESGLVSGSSFSCESILS